MIRVSELVGKTARSESGELLGQVREVRAKNNRVDTLICGPKGFLQRMGSARMGRRIKWLQVRHITSNEIIFGE
jgi:sporulation protein YlmC with PRC-barrel domain